MKVLTFSGQSPAEALKKVREQFGAAVDDIVVIETKEVRKRTLNQPALYELVVGVEDEVLAQKKMHDAIPESRTLTPNEALEKSEEVVLSISKAAQQFSDINAMATSSSHVSSSTNDAYEEFAPKMQNTNLPSYKVEDFKDVKKQIDQLTDKVKLIQNMFWEEKSPELPIPPEFAEIYKISQESGMNSDHLDAIMKLTLEHMPNKMKENSVTVKRYFQTLLRKMIPVRMESMLKHQEKRVMMFVGPTGVGKTTSVAKLAARYSYLMDKKYKVGLVVLDTYRIGAVEQLTQYARMMKLGIEIVVDPPEFTQAIQALSYCDYILIDTMGSSPYDQEKIEKLHSCLRQNDSQLKVDTTLVMPSHLKYEDMKMTYDKFEHLDIDTLMFTKLDETRGFGTIFSLLNEVSTPVSYLSVGQEVPEDLIVASTDYLVDCLLNGFSKVRHG
jgi:flagellar biosynthesis protein FlhF